MLRGRCGSWAGRRGRVGLFGAEGCHGGLADRSMDGDVGGDEGGQDNGRRGGCEDPGVVGIYGVELGFEELSGVDYGCDSCCDSVPDGAHGLSEQHACGDLAGGSEGHSQGDFGGAAAHLETHGAEEAEACSDEAEGGEA